MGIIRFKRLEQVLKKKYYKDFLKFMAGQTITLGGVIDYDFLRWINQMEVID